jgi:hypothetical protein
MMTTKPGAVAAALCALALCSTSIVGAQNAAAMPAQPGALVWFDLVTEDAGAVLDFYRELFGWDLVEHRENSWVALHRGLPIAGISQIRRDDPQVREALWLTGIAVADVDEAVRRARKRSATVHVEPTDVAGYGRYAVIGDPEQAPVMLLRPSRQLGGSQGPGAFVWAELWARDLKAETSFYREVIGYRRTEVEVNGGPYVAFESAGAPRAGLVAIPDDLTEVSTAWAPYVEVADLAAVVREVQALGGSVLVEPGAFRSRGSVALVADPAGAALFIYQPAQREVQP